MQKKFKTFQLLVIKNCKLILTLFKHIKIELKIFTECRTIGIHIHNDIDKKKLLELFEIPSGKRNESEALAKEKNFMCSFAPSMSTFQWNAISRGK